MNAITEKHIKEATILITPPRFAAKNWYYSNLIDYAYQWCAERGVSFE